MRFPAYIQENDLQKESEEIIRRKVDALLSAMTMEEKAELCHGGMNPKDPGQIGNGGYLKGVPRLGVPEIRMYDGPAGATSIYETTGLPAEEMLASAWDRDLAAAYGQVTGSENHMNGGNCQLGAEMDLVRTTHFNRTRDMLGEDPFLAGELGVPLVEGIQQEHVMACLKHFAGYVVSANPANPVNTVIDEQTMHELYLQPFEKCMREAGAACVMTAYSRINGTYASSSRALMQDILRDQLHFDGFVMCDWGANHNFSLNRGMDMEMPMGAYNSTERILRFIREGKCKAADLDLAARHILTGMGKAGYLSLVRVNPDGTVQEEAGRQEPIRIPITYQTQTAAAVRRNNADLAQKVAEEGAVLLKNEGVLPLMRRDASPCDGHAGAGITPDSNGDPGTIRKPTKKSGKEGILLVGTGAQYPICGYGQERSYGTLCYQTSPYEEISRRFGKDHVRLESGVDLVGEVIPTEYLYVDKNKGDAASSKDVDNTGSLTHGVCRYYGISREDGFRPPLMSLGGEGQELVGIAPPAGNEEEEEEDDPSLHFAPEELFKPSTDAMDMEGHVTGTLAGIDAVISFTTKSRDYRNSSDGNAFPMGTAYTWKGLLEAPEDGEYQLNLHAIGGVAVWKMVLDGEQYTDIGVVKLREGTQWPWGNLVSTPTGMEVCCTRVKLEKGHRYPFIVYGKALLQEKDLQLELAWETPSMQKQHWEKAVHAAQQAAHTILFIHQGFIVQDGAADGSLSFSEGADLELDRQQSTLLGELSAASHKAGGDLTVVAYNGSAFPMAGWIDKADALLYMWMPGQGGARALARLLAGDVVPSGKLPQSFPRTNEDTLVSTSKEMLEERWFGRMEEGRSYPNVYASEGIYTGYRWYDHEKRKPLFPFGFGLSYTTFAYRNLQVRIISDAVAAPAAENDSRMNDRGNGSGTNVSEYSEGTYCTGLSEKKSSNKVNIEVTFTVQNTGSFAADEIAQVYIGKGDVPSYAMAAEKTLCGFERIRALQPGEARRVSLTIPARSLCYWDVKSPFITRPDGTKDKWRMAGGERTIYVGSSSADLHLSATVDVPLD